MACDTDEEEGSQEGKMEIPGEGLCDVESIDQQGDEGSGSIAGSRCLLEEDCGRSTLYREPLIHYWLYV